ncbi:putative 4-hydroxybenzoate polyprenyltransferase [Nitratidesulfovibrio sp. HK-II]|uniref:UbiA-like polyprenyltransferase n=1 Tax=Nitratidesulfovibrio sp. HK-II TaxID=2009266 RepID=UPI000E2EFF67|nr:UbiA-like polyprenyltransferase [Nitratidesulfovibrio sp. HK-II]GBO95053.1 menaquinone via futalosine polyprenyltransferase [Nitratidesulfovibrio sp. HK-II]
MNPFSRIAAICRMIKIEHSVFALPFAYAGAFLAAGGWPGLVPLLLLTVAMVAVRSFAMAFNRLVDLKYDRLNPRTAGRPLVTGEISVAWTWAFTVFMAVLFVAACAGLNRLCLYLAPVALLVAASYSLLKRFTWLCHFFLGGVLGLAPVAGWISVDPQFTVPAVLLFWGVLFWVAGFDILYSCQDIEFDRSMGLHAVPAHFGLPAALVLSGFCHANAAIFLLLAGWSASLGWPWYAVWAVIAGVLTWEHRIISPDDLSRVNMAFFTLNGVIAFMVLGGALLGLYFG